MTADEQSAASAAKAAEFANASKLNAEQSKASREETHKLFVEVEKLTGEAVRAAKEETENKGLCITATLALICVGMAAALGITIAAGHVAAFLPRLVTMVLFIAMALASLGFGLFVVGATGSFKGTSSKGGSSYGIETAAPGLVVILCATVVIYFALDKVPSANKGDSRPEAATSGSAHAPIDAGVADVMLDASVDATLDALQADAVVDASGVDAP